MTEAQKKFAYHGLIYRATAMQVHAGGSSDIWWSDAAKTAKTAESFSNGDIEWKRYLLKSLFVLGEAQDVLNLTSGYNQQSEKEYLNPLYRAWVLELTGEKHEIIDTYNQVASMKPDMKSDIELNIQDIEKNEEIYTFDIATLIEKQKKLDKKTDAELLALINKRLCFIGDNEGVKSVIENIFPKDAEASYWQMFDAPKLVRALSYLKKDKLDLLRDLFNASTNQYQSSAIGEVLMRRGTDNEAELIKKSTVLENSNKYKILSWANPELLKHMLTDSLEDIRNENIYSFNLLGRIGGDEAAKLIIDKGQDKLKEGYNFDSLLLTGSNLAYRFFETETMNRNDRNLKINLLRFGIDMCGGPGSFDILYKIMKSGDLELAKLALRASATLVHLDIDLFDKISKAVREIPSLSVEFETIIEKGYVVSAS
jgi:hypothetical protein